MARLTLSLPVESENKMVTGVTDDQQTTKDEIAKEVIGNVPVRTRKKCFLRHG